MTLDPIQVVQEAIRIIHEANVSNRVGPNNMCRCGHWADAHYLGYLTVKRAGCRICDADSQQGYKCTGYHWEPTQAVPEAHARVPDELTPGQPANPTATMICVCGHSYGEHVFDPVTYLANECTAKVYQQPCACMIFDDRSAYEEPL